VHASIRCSCTICVACILSAPSFGMWRPRSVGSLPSINQPRPTGQSGHRVSTVRSEYTASHTHRLAASAGKQVCFPAEAANLEIRCSFSQGWSFLRRSWTDGGGLGWSVAACDERTRAVRCILSATARYWQGEVTLRGSASVIVGLTPGLVDTIYRNGVESELRREEIDSCTMIL
jgi:hypothetical protein